jgi:large subunit ribosomal protein L25
LLPATYSVEEGEEMAQLELTAEKRTVTGKKVKQLRREGVIPAVLYGHERQAVPLQLEIRALDRVLNQAGMAQLISLKVDRAKPVMALAREVQRDPITRRLLHVDFYQVIMTEKLTTTASLVLMGEASAVKVEGGVLIQGLGEVEIECLPGDLVEHIEVDLSKLVNIDDTLFVKDLQVPSTIQIMTDSEEMVAKVIHIRRPVEEVVEEVEEVEVAVEKPEEVEVIAKGKKEEEGEEAAEE